MTAQPPTAAPVVALASAPIEELREALAGRFETVGPLAAPLAASAAALPAPVRERVGAVVTIGLLPIDAAFMDALPALGLVACLGSGYEGVDVAAAAARGVAVTHSPAANAASVAEIAMGLVIASMRNFRAESDRLRAGEWRGNAAGRTPAAEGLAGQRLGIYGLGEIGRRVATRGAAFDMAIGYFSRRPVADVAWTYFDSLHGLAAWCDTLVIAVRASEATRHSVDRAVLEALGPRGHLVNIARGSVVDEEALVLALREGRIAGAGLDVYADEPRVPRALLELPNVFPLPHIGGQTRDARRAMASMTLQNLDAHFAGRPLPNPVPGSAARATRRGPA